MSPRSPHDDLPRALRTIADDVFPPTPPIVAGVAERIRQPVAPPPILASSRRRVIVLAAATLVLLAAAVAVADRLGIGTIGVRIVERPGGGPTSGPLPPALGRTIPLERARAAVAFELRLPPGPGEPDRVWLDEGPVGTRVAAAWRSDPSAGLPRITGTRFGLVFLQMAGPEGMDVKEILVKEIRVTKAVRSVRVRGSEGLWIETLHDLVLGTDAGPRRVRVTGNVLLWEEDGITYRLEAALPLADALALAASVR